jgi:pimeloyl-ACP methyl ester carboxylesterase
MMRQGAVRYLLAGAFRRMAWVEFGDPTAMPVICVHGLTRTGRDFDPLALALADRFRVICPDLPGRGASDWLPSGALYQPPSYVEALSHLLAVLGRPVHWVGTSLGGICGMAIAATPGQPIARIVLNDIGPFIPAAALARIGSYIGDKPSFPDLAALEGHLRQVLASFGTLTDAQWAHLAAHSARTLSDGTLALHYDPAIAEPMIGAQPADVVLWPFWAQITVPTLTIRGAFSDLLLPETLTQMGGASYIVPNAGHAPALMDDASIRVIRDFLTA